ncbi:hypothetical protein EV646_10291 [Kribbella antiqua]|uniref:Uncharacterized protein n=1 Tax=Kribbella antiqua TaxID=2512217 RepID=A0A4V6NNN5_9ACTN|nr:hypothetical protein [Kribbella antiqua]TCO50020.1 hypothetical protein EV646_10291 [Kribbella antiqua]
MTTPAISTSDPRLRARAAIGLALGMIAPDALALSDGRILLANSREQLDQDVVRRLEERLARRRATDEELVVEAVALLGAELDRGDSPVDSATQALDTLLDVPELSDSMRAETQRMLRTVLEGNQLTTETSVRRLAAERAEERTEGRTPATELVEAALSIGRQAETVARAQAVPAPARARRQVGGRHRRGNGQAGLAGRLQYAFGSRHEGRSRQVEAQYDEFRELSREWQQTRQGQGAREIGFVELDLATLAENIRRSGQPMPVLPWLGRQVVTPELPPQTPYSDLREQIRRQIAALERGAADQTTRADTRTNSAANATQDAADDLRDADEQERFKDSAAPERARTLRVHAANKLAMAGRHTAIAAACTTAAQRADDAREAYQSLLTELDALEASGLAPSREFAVLTQSARERVDAYKTAVDAALPSEDVRHNPLPSGRLPHLTELCEDLNIALKKEENPYEFTPDFLHRTLRAELRRTMSPGGFVLTIGNDPSANVDELTQFEFSLDVGELHEVLDSPVKFDEGQLGQVVQGGYNIATTATDTLGLSGGGNLKTAMAAFPDSSKLKALSHLVNPGVEFAVGRSHSVNGGATEFAQTGAVEALRGEILRYRSTRPRWRWRMRTSATGPWSETKVVALGAPHDASTLDLGYSHSYTVGPPAETVSLADLGLIDERSTDLPEHMASRVDGLGDLADQAVAGLTQRLGSLDRVGHDQLRGLIVEDGMIRLDESTRPGGIGRLITNGGRAVAYAQLESFPVYETFELLSDSSPEHKLELWRVGYTTASGGQTFATSNSVAGTLSYPGTALSDVGTSSWDVGPGIRAGRNTGREDGMAAADQGSRWSTMRLAPTLGVKMRMVHKLTVHQLDGDDSFTVEGKGDAFLRMLERDAFRYGCPVPAEALVRKADGKPHRTSDGELLLRSDPQPTLEKIGLPVWMGNGTGQLRGAGPALIRDFKGADKALRKLLVHLADHELIPPIDPETGRLLMHEWIRERPGQDDALVASQLENYQRVCQQVTKHRLESGYDAAAQSGLLFKLTKHRTVELAGNRPGIASEAHTYRIKVDQHLDQVKPPRVTSSDMVVNVDIGSNSFGRSGGRSKSLPWSTRFGFSNSPGAGQSGSTPDLGASYGRSSLGRFFNWATGSSLWRMSLSESTSEVAEFEIPHTITVTEVTEAGDSAPIAVEHGSAKVGIEKEFCDLGEQPSLSIAGRVDPELLQTATFQHLDPGDPVSRLVAEVPELARGDSSALHHLSAFLGVRNLVTRPELLTSEYRTNAIVSPAPSDPLQAIAQRGLAPRQSALSVSTRVENLKYIGSAHPILADLNIAIGSSSSTSGVSTGNTAGIDGGTGVAEADGSSFSGSAGVSRSGSRSAASTETNMGAVERTLMRDGQHYQFWGDLVFEAELRASGAEPRKIPLENGSIVLTLPERDALRSYGQEKLDLPLAKVSDAVERLLDGNLSLPRRTTTALIRRYQVEKALVTEGLAATHTDERLADYLRGLADLQKAPNESFDEVVRAAEEVTRQRVEVGLPRHYDTTMGAAVIDRTWLQDLDGNDTDMLREVRTAIEQHSPGALDDAVLDQALRGDLAGAHWRGHMEDMLDPSGFVREYPVGTSRNLKVRIRVVYDGPVTTEGGTPSETENAYNFVQMWKFREQSRSATATRSYGVQAGAAATETAGASAGLNTNVSTSTTATTSEQNTRINEAFWLNTRRVERDYRVIVEIEEAPSATRGKAAQTVGRLRSAPKPTRRESNGRMSMLVPRSVINARPQELPGETDHRAITLPANYIVEGTQPYLTGQQPVNNLFNAVYSRLSRRDMLTAAGVQLHRTQLENILGGSTRATAFAEMAGSGHELVPLAVPGHSSRTVAVRVRAEVSGLELISDPDDESTVQMGENTRELRATMLTSKSNRLLPTSNSVGGTDPATGIKAGMSTGEQVTEKDTGTVGARHETGGYESGQVVTVKVNVDYHLDVERRAVDRRGRPKVERSDTVHRAATGEAYLTMFRHEYDAMLARMEAGVPPLRDWDHTKAPKPAKVRTVKVNGVQDDQHPYRPLVEALAQARHDGVEVRLTLRGQDGSKQVYIAIPDGTMTCPGNEGFAKAFATLHPRLALLAEGRVDLQQLYDSGVRNGRFSGAVVEALQQQGIPAAVLTHADSTLKHATAQPESDGAKDQRGTAAGMSSAGIVIQ